ncbi:hypothetical protein [Proteus terrae]|uniref:hypothetical protein n=1 Tax=Proteus terrae TaxID=1574161 RepID=UPI00370B9ABB
MTDKTGGSAFPARWHQDMQFVAQEGMTLRDYFASKCMPAIINSLNGSVVFEECKGDFDMYAKQAYVMADAMLKAKG